MKLKHKFDLQKCLQHITDVRETIGIQGWKTKDGAIDRYAGFSLTYNPNQQENVDVNYSTLGSPKNSISEFFYNQTQNYDQVANSYYDTNAFIQPTPASQLGYIREIMASFQRTITRSRVMGILGTHVSAEQIQKYLEHRPGDASVGWHRDEPIHNCFRINIPVTSSNEFVFEMENEKPYSLETGYLYTWDTNRPHRVYAKAPTQKERWNIVIGCNPWMDLKEGHWVKNEFYGKNPMQMLMDGEIIDRRYLELEK